MERLKNAAAGFAVGAGVAAAASAAIWLIVCFAELAFVEPAWPIIRVFVGILGFVGLIVGALTDD